MKFLITMGLWALSLSAVANAPTPPAISVLTFAPGEVYWQRFGHNALLVRDAQGARVYNYGMFDFRQKNFFLNFARGQMLYRLDVQPLWWNLDLYRREGRWVCEQVLNLQPAQAQSLAAFLDDNAKPENAEYRYDYFLDNCSTRVRDALDAALGGTLKPQLEAQATPFSYRFEAVRLMSPDPALGLGMDVLLGVHADAAMNVWQQSFVPMALMQALRDARNGDAPLMASERELVSPTGADTTPTAPPDYWPWLTLAGLLTAALLWKLATLLPWAFTAAALLLSLFSAAFGWIQLLAWTLTDHWAIAANYNLLLFSPLSLLLILIWRWPFVRQALAALIAVIALAALGVGTLHSLPPPVWVGFWLPVHAVLAWRLRGAAK